MRTCPKCGELNGDGRNDCWKCHAALGPVITYRKICPKCGSVYDPREEICEKCGERLSVYNPDALQPSGSALENSHDWLYVVSALIPFLGLVLGCVYIAKDEEELGKLLIITGAISLAVYFVLFLAFIHFR